MVFRGYVLFLMMWVGLMVSSLWAHQVASVEFEFQNVDGQWRLLGEMDIAYMLPETRSVPDGLPLSREAVMKAPPEEFARIRKETENTLRKLLKFSFGEKEVAWRVEFPDFEKASFALPPEAGDIALLTTRLVMDPAVGAGELRVDWAGEEDTELIIQLEGGDEPQIISTLPGGSLTLLRQEGTGEAVTVTHSVFGSWVVSGFRHVLPLGLDHMLFMLGLFLLVPKWKPLLGQSLLFTLAHSATLALAVLGWVTVPEKWVEVLIAVSIAWIGIENLLTRRIGRQRLILVFGFGLIHGLGFASVLAEKLSEIPPDQLLMPLLGFNVGVEVAQIAVLCGAFFILWFLKKWTLQVQMVGSVLVALAGLGWVVERLFF
jgi:hydrogenase/urease accessory protein HupE